MRDIPNITAVSQPKRKERKKEGIAALAYEVERGAGQGRPRFEHFSLLQGCRQEKEMKKKQALLI